MLRIAEHTPTRLVLRDDQRVLRALAAVFTGMSALSVVALVMAGVYRFSTDPYIDRLGDRTAALVMFVLVAAGFTVMGVLTLLRTGISVTLDKTDETALVQMPRVLRPLTLRHAIYAVAGLDVEKNERAGLYGVYLLLRSGERIPLGALPESEAEIVDQIVRTARTFLRG